PEKVAAFIGVAPVVSELERQRAQRDFATAEARARGDADAQTELARIGEPPWSAEQELAAQTLVDRYGGYFPRRPSLLLAAPRAGVRLGVARGDPGLHPREQPVARGDEPRAARARSERLGAPHRGAGVLLPRPLRPPGRHAPRRGLPRTARRVREAGGLVRGG